MCIRDSFTEDQKLRANSVDLVEFLRRQGEKLIPSGRDKRLASDHSITVRGNEWYDHEAEEGGGPISFVQNFYGLTYPEAVTRLLGGEKGEVYVSAQKKERDGPQEFALPPDVYKRQLAVYLVCTDGHEFEFSYPLTPAEQVQLWDKMDAYCRQQNGQRLEEMRGTLLREQTEDTPEIQM